MVDSTTPDGSVMPIACETVVNPLSLKRWSSSRWRNATTNWSKPAIKRADLVLTLDVQQPSGMR